MSTKTVCDVCGRERGMANNKRDDVWGRMISPNGTADLCGSCFGSVEKHVRSLRITEAGTNP